MKSCGYIHCMSSIIPKRATILNFFPYTEHVTSAKLGSTSVCQPPQQKKALSSMQRDQGYCLFYFIFYFYLYEKQMK